MSRDNRSGRSGRGRFGGRSHGSGRPGGRNSHRNNNRTQNGNKPKKELKFHVPGSRGQYKSYSTVKEHLIQTIQVKLEDVGPEVANALQNGVDYDWDHDDVKPKIEDSKQTNATLKKADNAARAVVYRAEMEAWSLAKMKYKQGKLRAYAWIMKDYVTTALKAKIQGLPNFDDEIKDKPIILMDTIRNLTHETDEYRYPYGTVVETLVKFLNLKQQEDESLLQYSERFKEQRNVLKAQCGTHFLNGFVERTREYRDETDDDEKDQLKEEAYEKFIACVLLRNSDQAKYGTLNQRLIQSYSLNDNQYPISYNDALHVLTQHRFDPAFYDRQKKNRQRNTNNNQQDRSDNDGSGRTSFAQMRPGDMCFCCGSRNHKSPQCPDKNKRREDWWDRKTLARMSAAQTNDNNNQAPADSSQHSIPATPSDNSVAQQSVASTDGWGSTVGINSMIICMTNRDYSDRIILDSGSAFSLFKDAHRVTNIRPAPTTMIMATNAGYKKLTQQADVPGFGTVWFDKSAIANIFGLHDLSKTHHVTYDINKEDAFIATHRKTGEVVRFKRNHEGLYHVPFSDNYDKLVQTRSSHIETIQGNAKAFSKREVERARRARELFHILGTPSLDNYKAIIRANMIRNCPVTITDIDNAERIYGPSVAALKGKSTRKTPKPIVDDVIDIPPEIKMKRSIELCIDTMYINGEPMLTSIDKHIRYRTLSTLQFYSSSSVEVRNF